VAAPRAGCGRSADDPFGDRKVDRPAGSLGEVALEFAGAEDGAADAFGERLGAGGSAMA